MNNYVSFLQVTPWFSLVTFVIRFFVGIFLGIAVYRNGKRRDALEFGIPAAAWGALVIAEPSFGLIAYWLVNRKAPYREID